VREAVRSAKTDWRADLSEMLGESPTIRGDIMTISRVALYARVSTHDKDQDPDNQLVKLRSFAESRGWAVYGEYVDMKSGADASRPDLDRMLKAARGHAFNAIIIVRLDRIGRSVRNLLNLIDDLKRFNVELICTDQEIDTSSPAGKLLFTLLGAISEFELELIRDRTKDGLARARSQGKRLGRPPFAVSTGEIVALKESGMSLRQIGAKVGLSHQGVKKRLRQDKATKRVEN
jgi:DNA invertase Pin-like site-specific DNA recombinase